MGYTFLEVILMNWHKTDHSVFATNDAGETIAEVTFPPVADGVVDLNHTFVDPSLRGQGIAEKLLIQATEIIRAKGLKTLTSCSYAAKWFSKNEAERDLLA